MPICSELTTNFPSASRVRMRPPREKATFTCGMPLPRAFGTTNCKSAPHSSPPRTGTAIVQAIQERPGAAMAGTIRRSSKKLIVM